MAFVRQKQKKERARSQRLTRMREARRLARKGKRYCEYKERSALRDANTNRNNLFAAAKPKAKSQTVLVAPRVMDLADNSGDTIEFIRAIRKEWLLGDTQKILVDQSALESISPAAAVVFTAEIHRCIEHQDRRKKAQTNYPKTSEAASALCRIGFYRFFGLPDPGSSADEPGLYFRIVTGKKSEGRIANGLISGLAKAYDLDALGQKRLQSAIIECMDNVRQHAYDPYQNSPDLIGQWWLAAYFNPRTALTTVIFLDQGAGIPTTLRKANERRAIPDLFSSDVDFIETAVLKGLSRKKDKRRGTGLPSLRAFLDDTAEEGYLRIISKSGDFKYEKGRPYMSNVLRGSFDGTLILWRLRAAPHQEN